jgi:ribonuclease-3
MPASAQDLCDRLGVTIPADLLAESLIHRSYAYENGALQPNERLEFLGDAVLGLIVTDLLYNRNPHLPEGNLAKMRAALVSSKALAGVAREVGLGDYLLLGKGERASGGSAKGSILADGLEAVIGATYLGCGQDVTSAMVHRLFDEHILRIEGLGAGLDWKTSLQERTSRLDLGVPHYIVDGTGPDHRRRFTAAVNLADGLYGHGIGPTKKEAEQEAARSTFQELQARVEAQEGESA